MKSQLLNSMFEQDIIFFDTVFVQMIDDEMIILDSESENYFGLDGVGTVMWQLIQEHRNIEEVYTVLLDMYAVDSDTLEKDLLSFIYKLKDSGLIGIKSKKNEQN